MSNIISKTVDFNLDEMGAEALKDFLSKHYDNVTDFNYSHRFKKIIVYDLDGILATFEGKDAVDEDDGVKYTNWEEAREELRQYYIKAIKVNEEAEKNNEAKAHPVTIVTHKIRGKNTVDSIKDWELKEKNNG